MEEEKLLHLLSWFLLSVCSFKYLREEETYTFSKLEFSNNILNHRHDVLIALIGRYANELWCFLPCFFTAPEVALGVEGRWILCVCGRRHMRSLQNWSSVSPRHEFSSFDGVGDSTLKKLSQRNCVVIYAGKHPATPPPPPAYCMVLWQLL